MEAAIPRYLASDGRKKNTKFFHQRANQRRRKNHIEGLTDKAGVWQTDENKVAEMVEGYYQRLFTTSNPTHMNEVLNSVECVVTDGMQQSLLLLYTEDDVRVAFQVIRMEETDLSKIR